MLVLRSSRVVTLRPLILVAVALFAACKEAADPTRAASIVGMGFRYKAHLDQRRELKRTEAKADGLRR